MADMACRDCCTEHMVSSVEEAFLLHRALSINIEGLGQMLRAEVAVPSTLYGYQYPRWQIWHTEAATLKMPSPSPRSSACILPLYHSRLLYQVDSFVVFMSHLLIASLFAEGRSCTKILAAGRTSLRVFCSTLPPSQHSQNSKSNRKKKLQLNQAPRLSKSSGARRLPMKTAPSATEVPLVLQSFI